MGPVTPIAVRLEASAARVGLEVLEPAHDVELSATVHDAAGIAIAATLEPLEDRGPAFYAVRFIPPEPGEYTVRVDASGGLEATVEALIAVS